VHRLIERADAFVTGFRPGVAERNGLGYEELSAINPRLLYMDAVGYGIDGPSVQRALYARAAGAIAGAFGRQSGYWIDPTLTEGMAAFELQAVVAPWLSQIADGDSNAALGVFAALVLGIYHQRGSSEGQRVVTSMIASNAWAYSDDFCRYEGKPPVATCDAEYNGTDALCRLYRAADGWICLVVRTEREWRELSAGLGRPKLADDERFATAAVRTANDVALIIELASRFRAEPAATWEARLSARDVGCVEVADAVFSAVTSTDPVYRQTGLVIETDHPKYGRVVRMAPYVSFSETPSRVAPPCFRGQHNRRILKELGYNTSEITRLEVAGVIIPPG
jgi:crotonobetainyl-CoA:carnitine CoA-transferase CaiB-like acyl-CoA transferase